MITATILLLDILVLKIHNIWLGICAILGTCAYISSISNIVNWDKYKQAACVVSLTTFLIMVSLLQPQYFSDESHEVSEDFMSHAVVTEYMPMYQRIEMFLPMSFELYVIESCDAFVDSVKVLASPSIDAAKDFKSKHYGKSEEYKNDLCAFENKAIFVLILYATSTIIISSFPYWRKIKCIWNQKMHIDV